MNTAYWAGEFAKVLLAYVVLMYVWPSVLFRKHLKEKSRTYRFAFCSTVSIMLISTCVLGLGVFHILHKWLVCFLFYGSVLVSLLWGKKWSDTGLVHLHQLLIGTRGWKLYTLRAMQKAGHCIKKFFKMASKKLKGHKIEYFVLLCILVFGMIYFSYGAFMDHSYGFGDIYTHHAWIYGLIEGKAFSAGIYPEAMHCFIYAMHVLFGIRVYSCLLFLAGIHITTFLLAIYCLFKEFMKSRYTVLLILAAFLTIDLVCVDEVFSMSRLQWTLPQEFGLYTQFLCALFLIRYLRGEREQRKENGKRKWIVWDGDLFLFMMALATSFAIHFYVTIMAFFLCASFVVFGIHRLFKRGNLRSLIAAAVIGVIIPAVPMGVAYATGTPFQGSIDWALNVISGDDTKEGRTQQAQELLNQEETTQQSSEISDNNEINDVQSTQVSTENSNVQQTTTEPSMIQKIKGYGERAWEKIVRYAQGTYTYGYAILYGEERAAWIIKFTALALILGGISWIVTLIVRRKLPFESYFGIVLSSVVFMILYAAPFLGLPEIIAGARLCSTEQLLILATMTIPVDALFFLIGQTILRITLPILSLLCTAGIYVATNYFGVYHGYLYYELTRYNSVVDVTNNITTNFPNNSYTIISTTDELHQVVEYGRHEEMLNFLRKLNSSDYTLPTQYLFFYVEKKPIQYAQSHFFTGPDWLAAEKYSQYYQEIYTSEGDNIKKAGISKTLANSAMLIFSKESQSYSDLTSRSILESKMYYWCRNFSESYPNDVNVYYEDDNFICYMVHQNPYRLYFLRNEGAYEN